MLARPARTLQAVAAVGALTSALCLGSVSPASADASCPTEQGAKAQVAALVAQLHDINASERTAVQQALVRSLQTMRGREASTKAERVNLGKQISALAKTLHDADSLVARKAIITSIHALQDQKKAGRLTGEQRAQLVADNTKLEQAVTATADTRAQRKAITTQFRHIHESFTCTP